MCMLLMLSILENEWVKFLHRWQADELWKHYAKWNKPDMKEWILCNSGHMCVLVSLGCFNKMPQTTWFAQQKRVYHGYGGWEDQDAGAWVVRFWREHASWFADCCVFTWWKETISHFSSNKGTSSSVEASTLMTVTSQRPPSRWHHVGV